MNTDNINMSDLATMLDTLESTVASLRSMIDATKTKSKNKRAPKASADPDAPSKPKRQINPIIAEYNTQRKALYAEMVDTWKRENPDYANLSNADLKKAVEDGRVSKRPTYPDALKEHSKRLPHHIVAGVPVSKTNDAVSTKSTADKPAPGPTGDASTVASSDSETKKRRGPKPGYKLSEDEKNKRRAARTKNKQATLPPLPPSPSESD